jgi:hypothetical protein
MEKNMNKIFEVSLEASPELVAVLHRFDPTILMVLVFAAVVVYVAFKYGKK